MKNIFVLILGSLIASNLMAAECKGTIPSFELEIGNVISEVVTAERYFMNSSHSDAGDTYNERRNNLNNVVQKVFRAFLKERTSGYRTVRCLYKGLGWAQPGKSNWRTISAEEGSVFIRASLKRTTNGDWKKGPIWMNKDTAMKWKTGGHRRSETFVELNAKYLNPKIRYIVTTDLKNIISLLHTRGIASRFPTNW